MSRAFVTKKDIAVLAVLLIAGLAALGVRALNSPEAATAQILLDGVAVKTVRLDQDQIFEVPGRPQVQLEVSEGRCAFIRSDCPDHICVKSGFLGTPGESAACLPNRVALRILPGDGEGGSGVDVVAG